MKTIYLLLTRSGTVFSHCIRLLTGAPYTHVAVSVIGTGGVFCSFGRKIPWLPYPAGFVAESVSSGFLGQFPHTRCALLALDVSDASYAAVRSRLSEIEAKKREYRYNLLGAFLCGMGISLKRRRRYFCSQFVGELLERSHSVVLPKPASLMQPADYAFLPGVRVLFTGQACELAGYFLPSVISPCNPAGSVVY